MRRTVFSIAVIALAGLLAANCTRREPNSYAYGGSLTAGQGYGHRAHRGPDRIVRNPEILAEYTRPRDSVCHGRHGPVNIPLNDGSGGVAHYTC